VTVCAIGGDEASRRSMATRKRRSDSSRQPLTGAASVMQRVTTGRPMRVMRYPLIPGESHLAR
jgi:hypothetical protein